MSAALALARVNGYHLLPSVLFHEDGTLKDTSELQRLYAEQLARMDEQTASILTSNEQVYSYVIDTWRMQEQQVQMHASDRAWFEKRYGRAVPETMEELRAWMLQRADMTNLHWFIESSGEPWSDVHRVVALMRADSSRRR